jgi:GDP-L-fucose synthase
MSESELSASSTIFVAGHAGLAGSAIVRSLRRRGYRNIITAARGLVDLTVGRAVDRFFDSARPECVILAAAKVGGIVANAAKPAEFIRDNLLIQTHMIDCAYRFGVRKFVFLGSSCIYPRLAPQPMREEYLLTGPLEPTNEAYAIAKLAGIRMCQAYRTQYGFDAVSVLPTNLYGPNDNFSAEDSHVLPGLIRRMHDAKLQGASEFHVWGSGRPRREFLHSDDFGEAIVTVLERYTDPAPLNIGCGSDITIAELAEIVRAVVGLEAQLVFDTSKPDGTPQKLLDSSRMTALGWAPKISLKDGIESVYRWFVDSGGAR